MTKFAHSENNGGKKHQLKEHLNSVADLAESYLGASNCRDEARLAGILHDLGKYGDTVMSAYVASIVLLVLLVVISVIRGRHVRAEMDKIEKRVMGNG